MSANNDVTVTRVLELIYGPALLGLAFAIGVNLEQSHEVIFASFMNFRSAFLPDFQSDLCSSRFVCAAGAFFFAVPRVFVLACVPAAVIHSSRWALRAYDIQPANLPVPLPEVFGTFALGGYILALFFSLEIGSLDRTAFGLPLVLLGLTIAFYLAFFYIVMRLGVLHDRLRNDDPNKAQNITHALTAIGAAFVLANMAFPKIAWFLGPVATTGGMLAVFCYILAGLTVASRYATSFGVPLIFGVVVLAILNSGMRMAWMLFLGVLLFGVATFFAHGIKNLKLSGGPRKVWRSLRLRAAHFCRRVFRAELSGTEVVGFGIAVASLASIAVHGLNRDCASISGCNIVRPVEMDQAERFADVAAAYGAWAKDFTARNPDADLQPIIVAAKGGGIFAAYHTAYFLAEQADTQPDEAQNLFAVSGISGGSIGAGVFWAIRSSGLCPLQTDGSNNSCHRDAVENILGNDFLSPVLAAMFTRDALDSVLPVSAVLSRPIDRGAVFESEVVRHFSNWVVRRCDAGDVIAPVCDGTDVAGAAKAMLRQPVASTWREGAFASGAPMLLMGTVDVHGGALRIMSPLQRVGGLPGYLPLEDASGRLDGDISLISAMVASARYPIVTPPMRVISQVNDGPKDENGNGNRAEKHSSRPLQLTDGGFFDNSGLEAIRPLIVELGRMKTDKSENVRRPEAMRIVFLDVARDAQTPNGAAGLIGTPVTAFLSSWQHRLNDNRCVFLEFTNRKEGALGGVDIKLEASLVQPGTGLGENFTLSWFVSDVTRRKIASEVEKGTIESSRCT